jgi:hypothetical protein
MLYPTEVLLEFLVTACRASGEMAHPEAEPQLRKVFSSRSRISEMVRDITLYTFQRWSPEQRVSIARALAAKGLPSMLDMMLYFDGKEQRLLRAKRIKDEAECRIAMDLLNQDAITTRQRRELNAMVLAYEERRRLSGVREE